MKGEASSANVASQQQTHDSGSNASSHDSKSSDSSVASKKESSSTQTEVSVRALSGFSGEMSTCPLNSYSASSVLPASEYGTYVASNLSDGDWSTAWVEGSSGLRGRPERNDISCFWWQGDGKLFGIGSWLR